MRVCCPMNSIAVHIGAALFNLYISFVMSAEKHIPRHGMMNLPVNNTAAFNGAAGEDMPVIFSSLLS